MSNETLDRKEVYVGRDFGGMDYEITPELVATYIAATGDDNPWYRDRSPLGGPVAPALILHSAVYRNLDWYLPNIYGNLHARQEWDLFAPVMVGERSPLAAWLSVGTSSAIANTSLTKSWSPTPAAGLSRAAGPIRASFFPIRPSRDSSSIALARK